MKCTRCGNAAEGPLSVAPNIHQMACSSCASEWRETSERLFALGKTMQAVLGAFRAFMKGATT